MKLIEAEVWGRVWCKSPRATEAGAILPASALHSCSQSPHQVWLDVSVCASNYCSAAVVGPELMRKLLAETERFLNKFATRRALTGYRCLVTMQILLLVNVQNRFALARDLY